MTRCAKCGRNNYGDVKKCSFCGAPLTFIPGEEIPTITEEDIQEKMSKIKVERIKNPILWGAGGIVAMAGIMVMILLFVVMMFIVYSPTGVEPEYTEGAWVYVVKGGEQMVFGKITRVTAAEDTNWDNNINHGYKNYTAYEINGDGVDNRVLALREGDVNIEPDVWVYSDKDLGEKGDRVLIKVESRANDFGEERAVSSGFAPWGGHGYRAGWIWLMPGLLTTLTGVVMFLVGFIGRADRSMERLLAEDKELRQQQLMLRQAAKKQMEEQERLRQWREGGISPQSGYQPTAGGEEMTQTQPTQTPTPGYPSQVPSEVPQVQEQIPGPGQAAPDSGVSGQETPQYTPPQQG